MASPKRILSSGDLVADRRADYAAMLAEGDDFAAAAELVEQALELAPTWPAGWFRLGEYRQKAGDHAGAKDAFRRCQALSADDIFGAGLKLAALGAEHPPAIPPSAYVEGLFDDYADRFETSLVEKLGYSVPKKLADMIRRVIGDDARFADAIDIGCGTGLFGVEIAASCDRLEGFDLSENMLAKAADKTLYQLLRRADLSLAPALSGLFEPEERHRADLVAAADVMMYLGDLDAAFANAVELMKPDGVFAFSVEKSSYAEGYQLLPSLRFAHSARHVEAALARHGLHVRAMEETMIRMDAGQPIIGLLFVAGV
jgi:predicted TPR repeat methyltransferase